MNLGKGQVDLIARDIREQLHSIGNDEREALRVAARDAFFRTKEGKMVQHLRAKFSKEKHCGQVCSEVVSGIEERAMAAVAKPFQYISIDELSKRVAFVSMDAENGQDLVDAVKREWYAKLKPAVRKQFGLK